jgi:hypothetical protein
MNQPHVSAAGNDVEPVVGEYFAGIWNHHDQGTCEVWLANAPESVLGRLQAMHPGVYVIHNDAPRSLREIEEIRGGSIRQHDRMRRFRITEMARPTTDTCG